MKKVFGLIIVLLFIAAIAAFIVPKPLSKNTVESNLTVTVSTFALYDAVINIARDYAKVGMVVPFGVDIHTYEPTPRDMIRIEKSDLFIFNGAGLEPWTKIFKGGNRRIDMSRYVSLLEGQNHKKGDHLHDHGGVDPHYWLDIENMIKVADKIEEALIELLGKSTAADIHKNAEQYRKSLGILDGLFQKRLSSCRLDTIVVSHNAFAYMGRRYGFHIKALSGLSPDAMPSAKTVAELADMVRKKGIKVVFYESFVSDRLIQSVAKESGARVEMLQPLANITAKEAKQFQDYRLIMNMNLKKLRMALECR